MNGKLMTDSHPIDKAPYETSGYGSGYALVSGHGYGDGDEK